MSSSEFPRDKEVGAPSPSPAPQPSLDEQHVAATTGRQQFNRRVAFLLVLLWIFWMLGSFAETVLMTSWAWRYKRLTYLEMFVYKNKWFLWLYLHYPRSLDRNGVFEKTVTVSATMFSMLILAYGNAEKIAKDNVSSAIAYLVMTAALVGAKTTGSSAAEILVVFLPFAWLLTETTILLLQRAGVDDLGKALGFSDKLGEWTWHASNFIFLGAIFWIWGISHEFLVLAVLVQVISRVYKILG